MLLAIETFVRLFERLLIDFPRRAAPPTHHADNDNGETDDYGRHWAAYR